MEIFHIAAECYPVVKVGGLGDVVGALPKYLNKTGHTTKVVIPRYETKFISENTFDCVYSGFVKLGSFNFPFYIQKEQSNILGFELYLVQIPELFDRNEVYGYEDDIERFLAFQMATLEWINSKDNVPDIINCHDHHTGLIPFMMQYVDKYFRLKKVPTVITIHSIMYQGQFGFDKLYYLPEFDLSKVTILEWDDRINSLATAIKCASVVSTVSPNFLTEINNYNYGLQPLLNLVRYKSIGILNGIDTEVWNPKNDRMIFANYSTKTVDKGKLENKARLCSLFNLDSTKPLFSFIGRFLEEKGADLLPHASVMALSENYNKINILILGTGNEEIECQLHNLSSSFTGNFNVVFGFSEELAHQIYAGSDFLLIPSRIESCGLNQMYSFRYGTIPIVRRTGGLKDTVQDIGDSGNGICHDQATIGDISYSIQRALKLYEDQKTFKKIRLIGMKIDHSWESVCEKYVEMYHQISY